MEEAGPGGFLFRTGGDITLASPPSPRHGESGDVRAVDIANRCVPHGAVIATWGWPVDALSAGRLCDTDAEHHGNREAGTAR